MILLVGVVAGLVAGMARARFCKRPFQPFEIKGPWLVLVAFLAQLIVFSMPVTRSRIPDGWAEAALVGSNILLLVFAAINIRKPGFWVLSLGLLLNFLAIVLNGGLMPVSPTTLSHVFPSTPIDHWQVGTRLVYSKEIILPASATRLWFLADRFTIPQWIPNTVAFSYGDALISLGAFWILWSLGGQVKVVTPVQTQEMLGNQA
jgi:hypothetical protein